MNEFEIHLSQKKKTKKKTACSMRRPLQAKPNQAYASPSN